MGVLLSSSARMLFALGGGILLYFLMKPDSEAYFSALLCASLLCLGVETAWAVIALRKAPTAPSSESPQGTPAA